MRFIFMPKSYLLLERAFAPALLPPAYPNWLQELYREEAPEYGSALSKGTVKTLDEFTPEEKEMLTKLNSQFNLLIEAIRSECIRLRIHDNLDAANNGSTLEEKVDLFENLNDFATRYSSRTFYANAEALFYSQVKQDIEIIVFNLLHNSLLHDIEKKRVLQYLLREIIYCAGGVLGHLDTAKISLSSSETLDAWLAKFRLTLIQQLASEYIRRNGTRPSLEIHVEILFLKCAALQKLNPYGYESRSPIKDNFAPLTQITLKHLKDFKESFLCRYNPTAIMEELAAHLHCHIKERLQKKDSPYTQEEDQKTIINLPKLSDFRKFFENIPLVTEPDISIYDIFSLETLSESSLTFKLSDERLYLKPISELKRCMLEIFIRRKTDFFKTYHDEYYTLVPHSSELCYQHNLKKPPFESSLRGLEFLKQHSTRLTHTLFILFYQNNVRNFSGCMLDDVNFSECDIQSLNLKGSTLYFQKEITPDQFISLFKHGAWLAFRAISPREMIEEALSKQDFLGKSAEDKGILLTYAVLINSPLFITHLLAEEADATIENFSSEQTAIMYAQRLKRWECVKALAPAKTSKHANILAIAAQEAQWDVVEILLSAKTDPNYQLLQGNGETALHFAASHNNARMVKELLEAGADPSLKAYRSQKTALEQAIEREHHACIQLLQNADFKKLYHLIQKPLFPPSIRNPYPFFLSFYENQFPPSIKRPFVQLCTTLRNDSSTSSSTKKIITDHFIYFLENVAKKYEAERYEEKKESGTLLEHLYESKDNLEGKLNGKPAVSNELMIALEHLFESILPENLSLRSKYFFPSMRTLI
jgi:hypothetical protein